MKTIKLDDDVRDVLQRSEIGAASLQLPNEQLERDLYLRVNKVLKLAGGKWQRGSGTHVFASDPRIVLGLAVESGAIDDVKGTHGQFFTPPGIAQQVVSLANLQPGQSVLEPSAGEGALLSAITVATRNTAVEIDPKLAANLKLWFETLRVVQKDFLQCQPAELGLFDVVLMNPPFTRGADIKHVQWARTFLKPRGRLVAIVADGPKQRELLLPETLDCEELPEGSFKSTGTNVKTMIIVMGA